MPPKTPGRASRRGDAPSELMKLRKAKAVGILDDHNRGVCDVHAHFDDGGADQHIDIPRPEPLHDFAFFRGLHSSVQKTDGVFRKGFGLQKRSLRLSCFRVVVEHVVVGVDVRLKLLPFERLGMTPAEMGRPHSLLRAPLANQRANHIRLLSRLHASRAAS